MAQRSGETGRFVLLCPAALWIMTIAASKIRLTDIGGMGPIQIGIIGSGLDILLRRGESCLVPGKGEDEAPVTDLSTLSLFRHFTFSPQSRQRITILLWRSAISHLVRVLPMSSVCHSGPKKARPSLRHLAIVAALALIPAAGVSAGQLPDFLKARQAIAAPAGSANLCATYGWACARVGTYNMPDDQVIRLARGVNSAINRQVHPLSDRAQYGVDERWTLPSPRGGDCEDVVLLKKKALVSQGVAPDRLLIATVLDRTRSSHAVLVLRTAAGDYVLDSLVSTIKPWRATGYSFLKMQDPSSPSRWNAIFAGGIFSART